MSTPALLDTLQPRVTVASSGFLEIGKKTNQEIWNSYILVAGIILNTFSWSTNKNKMHERVLQAICCTCWSFAIAARIIRSGHRAGHKETITETGYGLGYKYNCIHYSHERLFRVFNFQALKICKLANPSHCFTPNVLEILRWPSPRSKRLQGIHINLMEWVWMADDLLKLRFGKSYIFKAVGLDQYFFRSENAVLSKAWFSKELDGDAKE